MTVKTKDGEMLEVGDAYGMRLVEQNLAKIIEKAPEAKAEAETTEEAKAENEGTKPAKAAKKGK